MKRISDRQREVLSFIVVFREVKGYSPSNADISRCLGGTIANSRKIVLALERKGYVSRRPNIPRSVVPLPKAGVNTDPYFREMCDLVRNGVITIEDSNGEIAFGLSAAGEDLVKWIEKKNGGGDV